MEQARHFIKQERAKHLIRLARALYDSAVFEDDKDRLEMHRHVAVELKQLIDEAINEDHTLHPDLGLELLLFIELKGDHDPEVAVESEAGRKLVLSIIEELEDEYGLRKL